MKYGFLGAGNMAYSFIKGMIENGAVDRSDVFIYDKNLSRQDEVCGELQISAFITPEELIENCEAVFLAVKPNDLQTVLPGIAENVKVFEPLIISMAAGKTIEYIGSFLHEGARIIRIMPNVNAEIMKGMTAYCCNVLVTEYDKFETIKCLKAIGGTIELDEGLFAAFTSIASCAPAFIYMFIDSLATAAVKLGMNKKIALEVAAQTVFGSAGMVLESESHPRLLIDKVCSPGGATIDGICALQDNRFESAVVNAVEASYNKTKRL